jgi:hypothetical protein
MLRSRCSLLALCWHAAACAEVVSFPEDPRLVESGPWRCLGAEEPIDLGLETTATVRMQLCDAFGECAVPLTGLSAQVCAKVDVGCTRPLDIDIREVDGLLEFDVPLGDDGFDGYLAVSSPSESCTSPSFGEAGAALCAANPACDPEQPDDSCLVPLYVRALWFFNPPIVADTPEPLRLSLLSTAAQPALTAASGGSFDPSTGSVVVTGFDCDGSRALGVSYDMRQHADAVSQWYMANGILTSNVAETDATGMGGFVGVPPGFADVEAYNSDSELVGGVGVQVSAGTISYASLVPSR